MSFLYPSHIVVETDFFFVCSRLVNSGVLRRKSFNLGRNLAGSVGGFLPGAVTGMWDPQRDFAFLKLPTAGVRSVVALSR